LIVLDFPKVHSVEFIKREVINKHSLLYTITGEDPGNKLPYLLTSHMDVVPADPATWEVDPFAGEIVNKTFIYGRGAFDDKGGIMVKCSNKIFFLLLLL
jgi:acetylornithine deacetylase/succinyl-diaminopimelate desuccinylase-like protein